MELKCFSQSTPESEFDDWYFDTHGGTKADWEEEPDVDEVEEDDYSENDKDEV